MHTKTLVSREEQTMVYLRFIRSNPSNVLNFEALLLGLSPAKNVQ